MTIYVVVGKLDEYSRPWLACYFPTWPEADSWAQRANARVWGWARLAKTQDDTPTREALLDVRASTWAEIEPELKAMDVNGYHAADFPDDLLDINEGQTIYTVESVGPGASHTATPSP